MKESGNSEHEADNTLAPGPEETVYTENVQLKKELFTMHHRKEPVPSGSATTQSSEMLKSWNRLETSSRGRGCDDRGKPWIAPL